MLGPSQILRIPLAQVAPNLGGHDLYLSVRLADPVPLNATDMPAAIDGKPGLVYALPYPSLSIVRWDPFPQEGQELTLTFQVSTTVALYLDFFDYDCEQEDPIEPQ